MLLTVDSWLEASCGTATQTSRERTKQMGEGKHEGRLGSVAKGAEGCTGPTDEGQARTLRALQGTGRKQRSFLPCENVA